MIKLDDLITRVQAKLLLNDPRTTDLVVRETVKGLGLEVHERTGEVYSPAAFSAPSWEAPSQRNVRFTGQKSRRRR